MKHVLETINLASNGALLIRVIDEAFRRELLEKVEAGNLCDAEGDAVEELDALNWAYATADEMGALSEAPVLAEVFDCPEPDYPDSVISPFGPWYYYNDYQLRSWAEDLARKGEVIFLLGPDEETAKRQNDSTWQRSANAHGIDKQGATMATLDTFKGRCERAGLAVESPRALVNATTLRRRIEDALRKTARRETLLTIARMLGVKVEARP